MVQVDECNYCDTMADGTLTKNGMSIFVCDRWECLDKARKDGCK